MNGTWQTVIFKLAMTLGFIAATAILALSIWGFKEIDSAEGTFLVIFAALWCVIGVIGAVALGAICIFGIFAE